MYNIQIMCNSTCIFVGQDLPSCLKCLTKLSAVTIVWYKTSAYHCCNKRQNLDI